MTTKTKAWAAPAVSRDEARDLYLRIYDEFAVVINDEHDRNRGRAPIEDNSALQPVVDAINTRLDGTDRVGGQTIVRDWVNNDYEVWQCFQTHDSIPREVAEALFDDAWPPELIEVAAQEPRAETGGTCHCGCGLGASRNRLYRPGHDARHAGQVARAILAAGATPNITLEALETLPTEALQRKAQAQVARGATKAAKATKVERPAAEPGTVTRGRWRYPARRFPAAPGSLGESDVVERNTKRDGSGDWVTSDKVYDHYRTIFVPDREG